MNRASSSDDSDGYRVVLSLGHTGDHALYLRVSQEEGEEIRSLMEAEGVFAGEVLEFSAGHELLIYAASIGGGLTGLAAVMRAYFGRNRSKSITLSFGDDSVDMSGLSEKESDAVIDRFLRAAQERQAEQDAEWRRILGRDGDNH